MAKIRHFCRSLFLSLFFVFLFYSAFKNGNTNILLTSVVSLFVCGIAYLVLKILAFMLGPVGRFFINPSKITIEKDLIFASGSSEESDKLSKLGVATKFASLAMAGAMSEKGRKIGRNVYLGAATMIPSSYKKTNNFITFFHKNGLSGSFSADAKTCESIITAVNQEDIKLVAEYTIYLKDAKVNPVLVKEEVKNELQALMLEITKQADIAKSGSSAKSRQGAVSVHESLLKKSRNLNMLLDFISA
ncbi:hypothetical protein SAMN05216206_2555 [Pseudomonas guineae]|uniref:Uncharacterized protein n=1 Tax=Pseudomonas guineae TaxID=425504 RepID=A0A1I3JN45_9PSED|nr:hypothetical protein [Pseudomonas guineae]SFI61692.1 hypothetical protein SAMN05216206_2555 [Pseudomonas guineae]